MQMPSPTIRQSVSDPNLSKTHISGSPTRRTFRSKIERKPKHGRKSSSLMSSVNLQPYDIDMNENDSSSSSSSSSNTYSPYYRGLTDQSLAILDHHASCPPPYTPCYPPTTNFLPSGGGHSPYYKGLTDFSLVTGPWSPVLHNHPHPHPPTNSLSYESSPYYRGLTDYSLALHAPHTTTSDSSVLSINMKSRQEIVEKLTASGHSSSSSPKIKSDFTLKELMTKMVDVDGGVGFLVEEKPLRERVSEESEVGSALQEIAHTTLEEMEEFMTKRVDDDVGLVVEEKPLREKESDASQVGSVLEETAKKTVSEEMELMTRGDGDGVGLVIEAKPLRESKFESVLEEKAERAALEEIMELMTKGVDDDARLVNEEKPLRERVSEASNVEMSVSEEIAEKTISEELPMDLGKEEELRKYGLGCEKEKPFCVSEQTVASELACKEGGGVVTQEQQKLNYTAEEGNGYTQNIWAAKYQPMTLADFICNRDKALELKALVKEGCGCNHFIFEGPPSTGKRSMIRAMLRELFGADRVQVIQECKDFNLRGEMVDNLQVRIKKSLHHVEVNLSETKGYEKHVIVDLFKETYGKIINNSLPCSPENCQAIVLYEAEKLSTESLLYIKWLLEKYKGCNKVFFCCSDETKLQLVKPLCTTIRLSPPSSQEILKILEYIGKEEGIKLSRKLVKKLIVRSKNNLRQAILSLEATCRNKDALKDDDLILTGWEDDISNIAKNIIEEQSPRQLYVIRRKLQSLMIHDVPPAFIYKSLVAELTTLVDGSLRSGVAKLDKEYSRGSEIKFETVKQFGHAQNKQGESDERNNEPTKKNALSYLKIEEFIAKFMSWYKISSEKSNKHVQLITRS